MNHGRRLSDIGVRWRSSGKLYASEGWRHRQLTRSKGVGFSAYYYGRNCDVYRTLSLISSIFVLAHTTLETRL